MTSVAASEVGSGNVVANAVLAERPDPKPATMPSGVSGTVAAKLAAEALANRPRGVRGESVSAVELAWESASELALAWESELALALALESASESELAWESESES